MNDAELRSVYGEAMKRPSSPAECPSPEALLALVQKEGPDEVRLATLDHVMGCERCLPEFELLRGIERAGAATDAPVARSRRRWYVPVALAASILLAVAVVRRISPPENAARGAADAVVLLAPGASVPPSQSLTFMWHSVPGATGYRMEVLATDGAVVTSAETTDTTITLDAAHQVPAGTYRWWLRASLPGGGSAHSSMRPLEIRAP